MRTMINLTSYGEKLSSIRSKVLGQSVRVRSSGFYIKFLYVVNNYIIFSKKLTQIINLEDTNKDTV